MTANDQVEAVGVGVGQQRPCRRLSLDHFVLDIDAGALGAIAGLREGLEQVTAGSLGRFDPVSARLSVRIRPRETPGSPLP